MAQAIHNEDTYEQERRRVSSVVLEESWLEELPEDTVRYVEVPQIQEVVRHVPKKEVVEIEKRVPKYLVEYVERIVEVPQVQYVDKTVEVEQVQDVIKHVHIHQVVDVPKEVVKYIPKIETRVVEKIVEIPGEVIQVPKPYTVENKVAVPTYKDMHVPVVVAQTVQPMITESNEEVEVEVLEHVPEIIEVEVQVPKPVPAQLFAKGVVSESHRVVTVPHSQYNSLLKALNPHISDHEMLPFMKTDGKVNFATGADKMTYVQPLPNVAIEGMEAYAPEDPTPTPFGVNSGLPSNISPFNAQQQQPGSVRSRGVSKSGSKKVASSKVTNGSEMFGKSEARRQIKKSAALCC